MSHIIHTVIRQASGYIKNTMKKKRIPRLVKLVAEKIFSLLLRHTGGINRLDFAVYQPVYSHFSHAVQIRCPKIEKIH